MLHNQSSVSVTWSLGDFSGKGFAARILELATRNLTLWNSEEKEGIGEIGVWPQWISARWMCEP